MGRGWTSEDGRIRERERKAVPPVSTSHQHLTMGGWLCRPEKDGGLFFWRSEALYRAVLSFLALKEYWWKSGGAKGLLYEGYQFDGRGRSAPQNDAFPHALIIMLCGSDSQSSAFICCPLLPDRSKPRNHGI